MRSAPLPADAQAIIARARAYLVWSRTTNGAVPEIFVVTPTEYDSLRRMGVRAWLTYDPAPLVMQLFGMQVVCPRVEARPRREDVDVHAEQRLMDALRQPFPSGGRQVVISPVTHGLEDPTDPLPPLDDLDEGLHCCHQDFDTFAAYLRHRAETHRREDDGL